MKNDNQSIVSVNDKSRHTLGVIDMCKEAEEIALAQQNPELASQFTYDFLFDQSIADDEAGKQTRASVMERASEIGDADKCFFPGPYYNLSNDKVVAVRNNQREALLAIDNAVLFIFRNRHRVYDYKLRPELEKRLLKAYDAIGELSATKEQKGELFRKIIQSVKLFMKDAEPVANILEEVTRKWLRIQEKKFASYKQTSR